MESNPSRYGAVIGMGSNLGSRQSYLRGAVEHLAATPEIEVKQVSSVFRTAPIGPEQPDYLNAAVRIETTLNPELMMKALLGIERTFGRSRGQRWGPRVLDLDFLWAEGIRLELPGLVVPHPELMNRAFALAPLLEVWPEPSFASRLIELGGEPEERWPLYGCWGGQPSEGWAWGLDAADALAASLTQSLRHELTSSPAWERREWEFEYSNLEDLTKRVKGAVDSGFAPYHFVVTPSQNNRLLLAFGSIESAPMPSLLWKPIKLRTRAVGAECRLLFPSETQLSHE